MQNEHQSSAAEDHTETPQQSSIPHDDGLDKKRDLPSPLNASSEPISIDEVNEADDRDYKAFEDFTISEPYRYFLLFVGSVGCFVASFCYTFALFSHSMMTSANMSMSDLSSTATVMLVFSYFTLPYAFIFDAFGPKPVLAVGTVLLPLGCLLMALTFDGKIDATTVNYSVFLGIMGGGCIVFDIGTVVAVLSWFPTYRGPVVAVMKTFAGLGSAILATIQQAFFETDPAGFFYFLMATSLVLGLFTIATMKLPPYHLTGHQEKNLTEAQKDGRHRTKQLFLEQRPPRLRMIVGLAFVIVLIIYLPVESAAIAYANDVSHGTKIGLAVVVIVVLAVYPCFCLPLRCLGGMEPEHTLHVVDLEQRDRERRHIGLAASNPSNREGDEAAATTPYGASNDNVLPSGSREEEEGIPDGHFHHHEHPHEHVKIAGEDMDESDEEEMEHDVEFIAPQFQTTFCESLLTLRLWAIFAACFAIIGAQLVILFQYPFIIAALRGKMTDDKFKALLGALSGVGSAVGRLLLAWLEMFTQNRPPEKRIAITCVLFVPAFFSLIGLVFYLALPGQSVAFAHFLMAIGNGSAAAAAVLVFRGIFAKEPAKHYNFGFLAAMVSAILLNRVVYGEWYQHEVGREGVKSFYGICLQKSCVLMPLLLMLGLNALAFIAVIYVHFDYIRFVRGVLAVRQAHLEAKEMRLQQREQALLSGESPQDVTLSPSGDVVVDEEAAAAREKLGDGVTSSD